MIRYNSALFNYQHLKLENPSPSEYHNHMHTYYEFLYFLDGKAQYTINATTYPLSSRDLLLIPVAAYHHISLDPSVPYERICIHFSKEVLPEFLRTPMQNFQPVYHIRKDSAIDNLFSTLLQHEYVDHYSEEDMLYCVEHDIGILAMNLKYMQNKPEDIQILETNQILNSILDFIDDHITEPITAETLSANFFKSVSWITHIFASELKISPKRYINNKKIIYAQILIAAGTPPTNVASMLSFKNYTTFYKLYKKFLGKSPSDDAPSKT